MEKAITIRPATDADGAFLLDVYVSSRAGEVAAFGWDEAQQRSFLEMQFSVRRRAYAMQYPDARCSIILCDGEPAGAIIVDRLDGRIELTDIAILPDFRSRGIASRLIRDLQNEAAGSGVPLTLNVDRTNHNAFNLYLELGFTVTGETELNLAMQWAAPTK